jgi:hypothetical protein
MVICVDARHTLGFHVAGDHQQESIEQVAALVAAQYDPLCKARRSRPSRRARTRVRRVNRRVEARPRRLYVVSCGPV